MNGYDESVISILKHCNMFHQESTGVIYSKEDFCKYLWSEYGLSTEWWMEDYLNYDYIFLPCKYVTINMLISCLSHTRENGIIIIEITPENEKFEDKYISVFANFTASKVKYGKYTFLVIHSGVDYGN